MVTAKTQYNLKNAEQYSEEHLCVGDYYDESQRVALANGLVRVRNDSDSPGKSVPMIFCGCVKTSILALARS